MLVSFFSVMLVTQNLQIGYRQPLLHIPLALSLPPQQLTMLIGINGAGKSTLLRTLAGLHSPLAGTVFLDQKDLASYQRHQIAEKMSLVLTEKNISPLLTVQEMVQLGRIPHTNWWGKLTETDKKIIDNALQITQLEPLKNRILGSLSDGQRQKVHIARALAQDTPLLLLDEPTTHLDLIHRAEIFVLLQKITQTAQKTVLVVTHEIEFALQVADMIWLLHEGDFYVGTPQTLIDKQIIDKVFSNQLVRFDSKHGKVLLNK
jgi:iron complex transport system ATP-binding protein